MRRVEAYIGHGNFNLTSFDEMLAAGRNFPAIGAFDKDELSFLEEVFFANPHRYGFYGKKISSDLTASISRKHVAKVSNSGHFLFKGDSLDLYNRIIKDVGNQVILTSGVRSNVKQMHLFLAKAIQANDNLSRASRSLAPPVRSYHGIGDFDIGKIRLGEKTSLLRFLTPRSTVTSPALVTSISAIRLTTCWGCALNPGTSSSVSHQLQQLRELERPFQLLTGGSLDFGCLPLLACWIDHSHHGYSGTVALHQSLRGFACRYPSMARACSHK